MQNGEGETNAPVSAATLKDERLEQVNGGEARIPLFGIREKTDRVFSAPDPREQLDQL